MFLVTHLTMNHLVEIIIITTIVVVIARGISFDSLMMKSSSYCYCFPIIGYSIEIVGSKLSYCNC